MNDTNFYTPHIRPDELMHYGIKGMRWGVRRYENEDGTLTEAGKKRYGTKENYERSRTRKKRILKGAAAAAAALGYGIYRKGHKNNDNVINKLGVIRRKALTDNSNDSRLIDGSRRKLLSRGKTGNSNDSRLIDGSRRKLLSGGKTYLLEEYARSRGAVGPLDRSSVDSSRSKKNMYNFTKYAQKEKARKAANKFASRKYARLPYMDDVKRMLEYAKGHRGKNDPDIKDIIKYHYSDKPYLKWVDRIDKKYKSDLRKRFYND